MSDEKTPESQPPAEAPHAPQEVGFFELQQKLIDAKIPYTVNYLGHYAKHPEKVMWSAKVYDQDATGIDPALVLLEACGKGLKEESKSFRKQAKIIAEGLAAQEKLEQALPGIRAHTPPPVGQDCNVCGGKHKSPPAGVAGIIAGLAAALGGKAVPLDIEGNEEEDDEDKDPN